MKFLKIKRLLILIVASSISHVGYAQSLSGDYLGQKPPGESPEKFAPGIISRDDRYELMSAFSPDGKEFCFTVTNEQWSHFEIWYTKNESGKWTEPKILPFLPASGGFGPVFSPDNKTIYFSASNWVTHPSTIWYSNRKNDSWSAPVKMDVPVNSKGDQWQFSMAKDNTLIFTSNRQGGTGSYDLYISEPVNNKYTSVANLTGLNSPADEYSAFIAPDKSYIIFSSQRKGTFGWDDLYITFRQKNKTWTKPVNLGPEINTIHAEFAPHVSPDGKYLFYSKWDVKNKWSDIYWVRFDKRLAGLKKEAGIMGNQN